MYHTMAILQFSVQLKCALHLGWNAPPLTIRRVNSLVSLRPVHPFTHSLLLLLDMGLI